MRELAERQLKALAAARHSRRTPFCLRLKMTGKLDLFALNANKTQELSRLFALYIPYFKLLIFFTIQQLTNSSLPCSLSFIVVTELDSRAARDLRKGDFNARSYCPQR